MQCWGKYPNISCVKSKHYICYTISVDPSHCYRQVFLTVVQPVFLYYKIKIPSPLVNDTTTRSLFYHLIILLSVYEYNSTYKWIISNMFLFWFIVSLSKLLQGLETICGVRIEHMSGICMAGYPTIILSKHYKDLWMASWVVYMCLCFYFEIIIKSEKHIVKILSAREII